MGGQLSTSPIRMDDVQFVEELPEVVRVARGFSYDPIRRRLRSNRGVWAEVMRAPRSESKRVQNVRIGLQYKTPEKDIEAVQRTAGNETVLYARALAVPEAPQEIWGVRCPGMKAETPFGHREDAEAEVTRARAFGLGAVLVRADVVWTEVGPRKEFAE